jgi:hypothetical protein
VVFILTFRKGAVASAVTSAIHRALGNGKSSEEAVVLPATVSLSQSAVCAVGSAFSKSITLSTGESFLMFISVIVVVLCMGCYENYQRSSWRYASWDNALL